MAQAPERRRKGKVPAPELSPRKQVPDPGAPAEGKSEAPAGREDPGDETSGDTKLVNALESNPEFFKDPLRGTSLGKCAIEQYIGEGKTSIVYRAHYQPLKRTVAVKVLQAAMTKVPAVVRVFQLEGRAVAAIDHENVLKIYDVGEDRGYHYMVLELLKGKNLLEIIEHAPEKRLPVEEALRYVQQAARGLAAAQRKNLVHRDIKPQNLVIEPDGTLKIVDFGLAAESEGAFSGGRLGTPHYMSPEQCRGENASAKSDIYSLGITLFHMLVGHPPFAGKHTKEEIIEEHLKGRRLEPEKLRKDLSRAVGDLVRRMTRMETAARPSAPEVYEQIAKLRPEDLSPADAEKRGARAIRGARRKAPVPPVALAAAGLGLVGIVAFLLTRGSPEEPRRPVETATTAPAPAPPPVASVPKTAVPATLDEELRQMFAEAEREEQTKNLREAHRMYINVLRKAPAGSTWEARAKAAALALKDLIDVDKEPSGRTYVTPAESRQAGEEFEKALPGWYDRLKTLQGTDVKTAMAEFLPRTRAQTPERQRIEDEMRRAAYVEQLAELVFSRAHSLSAGKERWSRYEMGTSDDLVVTLADAKGVHVVDTSVERAEPEVKAWGQLPPRTIVRLLDAVRSEQSPRENLCLGWFCKLVGHDLAETYFENALQLDHSAAMKAEVAAARQ